MEHVPHAPVSAPPTAEREAASPPAADFAEHRLPVPAGWYFVGSAAALRPGGLRRERLAGRDLALWRTASGLVRAAWNLCPHMGGRLADNGSVRGEALECGLHRRRFGPDGACERRGEAGLALVPTREVSGLVLAWYHPAGAAPTWEVPAFDTAGFTPVRWRALDLPTHPHHVMQDLADPDHFTTIHRYEEVTVRTPLWLDGPRLGFGAAISWRLVGLPVRIPIAFESDVAGLGFQRTEVTGLGGRLHTRHLVLPTPLDRDTTRVHLGLAVKLDGLHEGLLGRLGGAAQRAVMAGLEAFAARAFARDIGRDAGFWVGRYHTDDRLPAPDEAIARFRGWANQFY